MARAVLLATVAVLVLAACGGSGGNASLPELGTAPDVALVDANTASPTYGTPVSPRDHLGRITAWYFDEGMYAVPT